MTLSNEPRRFIPSVDKLLAHDDVKEALARCPRWAVVQEIRGVLEEVRAGAITLVTEDGERDAWVASLAREAARRAERASRFSLRPVVNATGVVLHTNLGRALLAPAALEHVAAVAGRYSNVELDLASGERGHRYDHVRELVATLSGAEDAIVVNNDAAAVLLCLSAFASGREVVVSRGELVEIGGSFRVPDVMAQSGCRLVEVGTTNRTHLRDYEGAIRPDTALLLKVHTSNFRIVGFTKSVPVPELVPLARQRGIPIMNDLGAGCLVDPRELGLPHEPTVQESVKEGADLVTFSGDKLLGGPQLGVIAGRKDLIARLTRHPLLRALRVDKMTLAAFEATLRIYRDTKDPIAAIPTLRMLRLEAGEIKKRAEALVRRLPVPARVVAGESQVGAGAAPGIDLPTFVIAIRLEGVDQVEARLRAMTPPVLVRVHDGELLVDLRTVAEDEEETLAAALAVALQPGPGTG